MPKKKVSDKVLKKLGIPKPKKKAKKKTRRKKPSRPPKEEVELVVTENPPKKKRGAKPKDRTPDFIYDTRRRKNEYIKRETKGLREIMPDFPFTVIDWVRRLKYKNDLAGFGQDYLKEAVPLPLAKDHIRCIAKMEEVVRGSGKFALAMPRGEGKTTWCIICIIWSLCYGWKHFIIFVGARDDKAKDTLDAIKSILHNNPRLIQDFPEICYAIQRLEGRWHGQKGQLFNDMPTYVEWNADRLRIPALVFSEEIAQEYLKHDKDSVIDTPKGWMNVQGGSLGYTYGIKGSIRGDVRNHPVTNALVRPDFVLLDDIQRDADASSPLVVQKTIKIIDGAIQGMSGPTEELSCIMPCTVIQEGDVAETYLTPEIKYAWRGERCSMVTSWPDGIDDYNMSPDTRGGSLWLHYSELRKESLQKHKDNHLATDFYAENREEMDKGFEVSWEHRKGKHDLSAQQHAMNLRLDNPETFPAEYQNRPRPLDEDLAVPVKAENLRKRLSGLDRNVVPIGASHIVSYIDVQSEMLYYVTFAGGLDFTGSIIDYGTWPEVPYRYFTRKTANNWMLMSKEFWKDPDNRDVKPEGQAAGGAIAPFESRLHYALDKLTNKLWHKQYMRADYGESTMVHSKIAIDGRWGQATETIRQFCVQARRITEIVTAFGQGIRPDNNQYEEYDRTKGWLFEDQVHRGKKECNWIWRLDRSGQFYLAIDANRMKDFLMNRLACPAGSPGSITLFQASEAEHEMFADQICKSEAPEALTGRGRNKNMWKERDGGSDNEYLDCSAGALVLSSWMGARIREHGSLRPIESHAGRSGRIKKRKLSEVYAAKQGR